VDFKLTPPEEVQRRLDALEAAGIPPSVVIHSGGGLHLYWAIQPVTVDTEADRAEVKRALKALQVLVAGDPHSVDVAHILRLPGTYNRKPEYGEPRFVELVGLGWDKQNVTREEIAHEPVRLAKLAIMAAEQIYGQAAAGESQAPPPPRADREEIVARAMKMPGAVRRETQVKFCCPACADNRFNDAPAPHDKHRDNGRVEIATGWWGCAWDKAETKLHNKAIAEALGVALPAKLRLKDFWMHAPSYQFIFAKTGDLWPGSSVDSRVPGSPTGEVDSRGKEKLEPAHSVIARTRCVEQLTWYPGEPQVIEDKLLVNGQWQAQEGSRVYNLYRPAVKREGDPKKAGPWLDLMARLYPDDFGHLVAWFAHRVQRPGQKVNHAIVLGGSPGIGKDSLLEPVGEAVGRWNVANIRPMDTMETFNPFVRSVLLRISEVRDLGEIDRRAFYEHMKTYIAAPPDVHMCNEKHLKHYAVPNVCGVIMTTNHQDALFLTTDDRRHFVAWSDATPTDWGKAEWDEYYGWLEREGHGHVAAFLNAYDLSKFSPKEPPRHTKAFAMMLGMSRPPEDDDLAAAIELLREPVIVTMEDVARVACRELQDALTGQGRQAVARTIPRRMEKVGYRRAASESKSGKWSCYVGKDPGRRQVKLTIYARKDLNERAVAQAIGEYLKAFEKDPRNVDAF
jgi:hypothetical protein